MGRVWGDSGSVDSRQKHPEVKRHSPPGKVWNAEFMEEYTDFDSIYEFLTQSPWEVLSMTELEKVPENPRDAYVDEHTEFADIAEMQWVANTEWVDGTLSH